MSFYLKNRWYVAAWNYEITDQPLARTIMDEPVVFFRDRNGIPAALEDSCAHRYMALSEGQVINDHIQCPYHGLEFDRNGYCVLVPGQKNIPPGASVRCYPVAEKWRYIWIWPGDPELADENLIPDFHWNKDPNWVAVGDYFYVKGNYRLLIENLLDLSHVAYVHASTLGTDGVANFPVKVTRDDNQIHVERWIFDEPAPAMFRMVGDFKKDDKVDRWQLIHYLAPTHFMIDVGCALAGTGAQRGYRSQGVTMFSNHTLTPETEKTTHYFWHHARNFRLEDDTLTEKLANSTGTAFAEDVIIIETQQDRMERLGSHKATVDINADAGVLQARRLLDGLIERE